MLRSLVAATAVSVLFVSGVPGLARADKGRGRPAKPAADDTPKPEADTKPEEPAAPEPSAAAEPAQPHAEPAEPRQPPPPPPDVDAAPSSFHWEPYGYLRLQYIQVQSDPNVAFVGRDGGFELQNARVGARGRLNDQVSFAVAIDGAVDERTQINNPQGKLAVGLRDAYADVAIAGAPSAPVFVRAGYFQSWADPEALVPDTAREFVDKPLEDRGVRATEGYQTPGLTPGRSLGVALRLDPGAQVLGMRPGFELAVQNGADEFSSNNDNNLPAVSFAGVLRFPHDGFLLAAVRYNPRTIGDLPFRQDEDDLQGALGVRVGAGPVTMAGGVFVQQTTFPTTGGPSQTAYGGHAQLMIRVGQRRPLSFGYRFDILDPSSLVVTDRVMEHTLGAVLGVPAWRMRFQAQLVHVVEQAERDLSNDRVQIAAEVAL